MTEPRPWACLRCRRPLSWYVDEHGAVTFLHPLATRSNDHDPVPRPAEEVSGIIHVCDFCSTEDSNLWEYITADISVVASGPGTELVSQYGTTWAACPLCAVAVTVHDLDLLHAQALAVTGQPREHPASAGAKLMMATTLAALRPGRRLLIDGTEGPAPDLPLRLLPKIRDRLAVLLAEDTSYPSCPTRGDAGMSPPS